MGEVIKRQKDGKFIGWYIRYYDADGEAASKRASSRRNNEARRMLLQIEAQIARGESGVPEPKEQDHSRRTVQSIRAAHPRAKVRRGISSCGGIRAGIASCR